MKRHLGLCVATTVVWLISGALSSGLFANELLAPENAGKYAITDPAQVDADYAYQGEYAGRVCDPQYGWIWTGLQVIARGDGKFEAVQYRGGLPGAGWDRQTKRMLAGQLADDVLVLNAEDGWSVTADGQTATATSSDGRLRGTMTRQQRISPTLDAAPPHNAVILFDGTSAEQFTGTNVTEDGLLDVGGLTKFPVHDFRLHLEFRLPYMPYAQGQGRSNSGVYIQQRYEVQILDSYGLEGRDNECGGIYKVARPRVNACAPPLQWQTYDIEFRAPRFDANGTRQAPAVVTVRHNGVLIQDRVALPGPTGGGQATPVDQPGPLLLQDHGNPVQFRTIWVVPLTDEE